MPRTDRRFSGDLYRERAARRVERARAVAGAHPANRALDRLGLRR
jgi:hypothetical protein